MEHLFRIFDFNVYNDTNTNQDDSSEDDLNKNKKFSVRKDKSIFMIQMFGLNEKGETCSIQVEDFKPFFYVMVNDKWNTYTKECF